MRSDPAAVGNRIRLARRSAGLSIKELARRAHISPSHLSDVERGVKYPSLPVAATLARLLGRSLDWLVTGHEAVPGPLDLRVLLRDPGRALHYQGVPLTDAAREYLVDLLDAAWNLAWLTGAVAVQAAGSSALDPTAAPGSPRAPGNGSPFLPSQRSGPEAPFQTPYPDHPMAREWVRQVVADALGRYLSRGTGAMGPHSTSPPHNGNGGPTGVTQPGSS
ncbi:MAG TPA: helix-turn-helix transcriptional regulator [Thermaerobacter sp.]